VPARTAAALALTIVVGALAFCALDAIEHAVGGVCVGVKSRERDGSRLLTQEITAIVEGQIFRAHGQPCPKRSTRWIKRAIFLPDGNEEIIDTLFCILSNTNAIQHQTNKIEKFS